MPADGISLPPKGGTSARPTGAARRLGYINHAAGRKGVWLLVAAHLGPHATSAFAPLLTAMRTLSRPVWGQAGRTVAAGADWLGRVARGQPAARARAQTARCSL